MTLSEVIAEVFMYKQRTLPLSDQASFEDLWESFPRTNRDEVVSLYASLIARAAQAPKLDRQEGRNDKSDTAGE